MRLPGIAVLRIVGFPSALCGRVIELVPEVLFERSDANSETGFSPNELLDIRDAQAFSDQNGQSRFHVVDLLSNPARKAPVFCARKLLGRFHQVLDLSVHFKGFSIDGTGHHSRLTLLVLTGIAQQRCGFRQLSEFVT